MIEDNSPSDIWFASLTDPGAEVTGIYFNPLDDKTLYVNVQHSAAKDGDATWAITRKGKGYRKQSIP